MTFVRKFLSYEWKSYVEKRVWVKQASNVKDSSYLQAVGRQAVSSSSAVVKKKRGFPASLSSPEYRTIDLNLTR